MKTYEKGDQSTSPNRFPSERNRFHPPHKQKRDRELIENENPCSIVRKRDGANPEFQRIAGLFQSAFSTNVIAGTFFCFFHFSNFSHLFPGVSSSSSNLILTSCQKPVSPPMSQNLPGNFFDFIRQFAFLAKYTERDARNGFWYNPSFLIIGECRGMTESGNWTFWLAPRVATDFLHFSDVDIIDLSKGFVND
jgi:hypothetical protein